MELSSESKMRKIKDAAVSAQTTISSDAVDTAGFAGVVLFTTLALVSGTANFIKAEQSAGDGSWEDIEDAAVIPATDGDLCWIDIKNPLKRYVRLSIVRAGAAFASSEIFAIGYDPDKSPVDNIDNGIIGTVVVSGSGAEWAGRIATPTITSPESGDIDTALDALITSSTFALIDNDTEVHEKSQFQITAADDTEFLTPVLDEEVTADLEQYQLAGTELDSETNYLIRVRYYTANLGWSDWSIAVDFNTISSGLSITGITPASGANTGGTAVTIDGTEFVAGIEVEFDGVAATSVVRVSATRLTCVTPVGTDGAVDVTVTNTDSATVTETEGFTFISTPTISDISPASGVNTGGTAMTITGTEFGTTPAVTVGGVTATSIVRVSATEITCVTPEGTDGAQDVVVTNTDTGTVTEEDGFTYISTPTITLIDPATGAAAGGTAVTITGTEFGTTPAVTFDGVTATSIVRVSATSITCVTPAGTAGAVDVIVTNTDTGSITATDGFTYTE